MESTKEILQRYWGYNGFRPLQEEIIDSVLQGRDTLALLPTGGGKSLCFQVPALAQEGICLVVSPLIALMKDQVENLRSKGIKALAITSGMSRREIDIAFDNCIYGNYKFLYLSPERLGTELARTRIAAMKVNLVAVDEAHCISQWGYDFRPSYLKISALRELVKAPVLALTASAQADVIKDIQEKLLFKQEHVLSKSFERKNIAYVVLEEEDKLNRLLKIIRNVQGTGIVYVRNRRKTEEVVRFLNKNNCSADFYHAGMPAKERIARQDSWTSNRCRVMVCTNAFGMGIDKPDVRFVVHLDLPDCIEAYFQEAGRAGRDGRKAYAVLLYSKPDKLDLEQRLELAFPSMDEIKRTYEALGNYYQLAVDAGLDMTFDFDIHLFCSTYGLTPATVFNCLKLLEKEEYISVSEELNMPSRIRFTVNNTDLYNFQVSNRKYDEFVKLLLRSYSGLFDHYVKINETELAKRCNLKREEVVTHLQKLDEAYGILNYLPQKSLPQVTYTQARVDRRYLTIDKENLSARKKKMEERVRAMVAYATEKNTCRNVLLLRYFGEADAQVCGHCDVCIANRKKELSSDEYEAISSNILHALQVRPLPLSNVVLHAGAKSEEAAIRSIQLMLDDDILVYNQHNELEIKAR